MVKNYKPHQDEIIRLYRDHTLDDVVQVMEQRGFKASRRWYLKKLVEWGCQKTSNRKPIQKRRREQSSVRDERTPAYIHVHSSVSSNSPSPVSGSSSVSPEPEESDVESQQPKSLLESSSPKRPAFIDVCPHLSCKAGPFIEVQDYLDHKAAHEALVLKALAWEGPTRPSACDLAEYLQLRLLYPDERVQSMHPGLCRRVSQMDSSSITQLDILQCLEVPLDAGRYLPSSTGDPTAANVCSIKAIVSGEVDYAGAESSLKLLLEVVKFFFEKLPDIRYPSLIGWTIPCEVAVEDWDFIVLYLDYLRNHPLVLSPFDRYIPTFFIQNYIKSLQNESDSDEPCAISDRFFREVLDYCEKFNISLDIKYVSILLKFPRKPDTEPSSPASES